MEIGIPLLALGALYFANHNAPSSSSSQPSDRLAFSPLSSLNNGGALNEGFTMNNNETRIPLPNTDVPDINYPVQHPHHHESVPSSHLSANHGYGRGGPEPVYTDKYFAKKGQQQQQQEQEEQQQEEQGYTSLSGQPVDLSYFKHNNMQPYFGGSIRSRMQDENTHEGMLDNMMGTGSQHFVKVEQGPLFAPQTNLQFPFGMPNQSEFVRDRMHANVGMKMSNVTPMAQVQVGPGLAGNEGGGYNNGMMARDLWVDKNVDEMRTANNPKASEHGLLGYEGPADSMIKQRGALGVVEKNRVERTFEHGPERYFTTTGVVKAEPMFPTIVERDVNRTTTTASYTGAASGQKHGMEDTGLIMPSTRQALGALPLLPAYNPVLAQANEQEYGHEGMTVYENNRSSSGSMDYFGAVGGAVGSVVAPLLDWLKPTRKENIIGTMRPYQNPKGAVAAPYVYDPNERLAPTLRETLPQARGDGQINRGQSGTGYLATIHQPAFTARADGVVQQNYVGTAGSMHSQPTSYEAAYRQRNNVIKENVAETGHTPAGNTNSFQNEIHQRQNVRSESDLKMRRDVVPQLPTLGPDTQAMGHLQGQSNGLYANQGLDRTQTDVLTALESNPYTLNINSYFAQR